MRTLKFRGKCTAGIGEGKWIYGLVARVDGLFSIMVSSSLEEGEVHFTVDEDTIGQFTGLYDANGKEIYEGDCLKYECITRIVYFEKDTAQFKMVSPEYLGRPNRICHSCCLDEEIIGGCYSVFGNVYDNPELLK